MMGKAGLDGKKTGEATNEGFEYADEVLGTPTELLMLRSAH